VLRQPRATQRYLPDVRDDEEPLTQRIIEIAGVYGRYGTPRVTGTLKTEGWHVNHKRVERIWRQEGLKVPKKQPKRGRLWLNDGSCIRLRPERKDHVWAYDFVQDRTHDGRPFRMLTLVDEYTRECLAIDVARRLRSDDVLERLAWLFATRGVPDHIRSDNGPEFAAKVVRSWLAHVRVKTLFIQPGSPWEIHAQGGEGAHRALAAVLQPEASAQLAGISTPGPRSDRCSSTGFRYAPAGGTGPWKCVWTNICSGMKPGGRPTCGHVYRYNAVL
jgi:hypothetical protein